MTLWLPPPSALTLSNREVHVWRADLGGSEAEIQTVSALLAPDERQKGARFYFEKDRHQYCATRGLLRLILSRYLSKPPGSLQFTHSPYGKPFLLVQASDHDLLQFNVSHSHEIALIAVARHEVGIDVEYRRAEFGWQEIVSRYFSENEVQMLAQVPQQQQNQAFYEGWTRKEAYIKARGQGLSISLNQFDVSLAPDVPAALLRTADDQDPIQWTIQALELGEAYAGAVAVPLRYPIFQYWCTSLSSWMLEPNDEERPR